MKKETGHAQGKLVRLMKRSPEFSAVASLLIMFIAMTFASRNFLMSQNLINIMQQISITAIIAIGQAMVIITGNIYLAAGSALSLGGVMAAALCRAGMNPWLALLLTILVGMAFGFVTGILVEKAGINAFIVTLGMDNIIRGCAFLISKGMPITFTTDISFLGSGKVGPVYVSTILMLTLVFFFDQMMRRTVLGKQIHATGCNANSARLSGVKVTKIKIGVFMLIGALAAFAGIINAGNLLMADTNSGSTMALDTISASVIGGVAMSGGSGTILGAMIGALIMGVLKNAFVLLRISSYWQMVTLGLVVIGAVYLDTIRTRGKKK